ncbi:macrolide family glycosyltransferase [Streptomyces sp. ATexAB-D23]|uniref:macrolide family glycosyltransferase n=1 Tax=unclassified Streptomyces TaxID=2593676 RepID=UPI00036D3803|nr:macrolide family glycosyltransferase [Streptomyces sp. ATexAB-D23]MYY03361.1 MGT family glycosyltransferase [Streptomyces sp. SID4913]
MNALPAQDGPAHRQPPGPRGHVGVCTFPAYAHIAPAVPMMAELVRRGHRVTCFVTERFTELVRGSGAEAVVYPSRFPWANGPTGSALENILAFFEEALAPLETAVTRFDGDRPDVIAHDLAASEGARLLARAWDVPVLQLCPTIASGPGFSMSERQNQEVTGPPPKPIDPADPAIGAFVERRGRLLDAHRIDGSPLDGFGAEHGDNIVFLPKEFQPAAETFDDRFSFIGPCLADPSDDTTPDPGGWQPPEGRKVVLLSLGSSYTPDQAAFLRFCVEALADSPWHLVVTLGHRVTADELGPLPAHVETHQWLRHPEVLRHAAAFITHAGMGSVMESLAHGVPMVLVPYHIDQRVIARQAAGLDLGRVLMRESADPAALRAAVEEVATAPRIAAAVAAMRRHVHEAGGASRGADVVERLMRRPGRPRTHHAPPKEVTHP